jgi:nicotinate-nucleotide adenylyltransferase
MPPIPERLGLFGGTFDPPHCGHVTVARGCVEALALDRLLLVVANDPWMKAPARHVTPAEDRFALVEAAAAGIPRVTASRIEIDRGGPSYTVDTVEQLRGQAERAGVPAPELFVIIGADLVAQLETWHRVDDLRRAVTLAVVTRPGSAPDPPGGGWRWRPVDGGGTDVSSSEVRNRLEQGESVDGLAPPAVIHCIRARNLYAMGR